MKKSYSTDLSDAEWRYLEPHVPLPNKRGRPRAHANRQILDAVFYVLKSGCPWRLLPREFPPWETVYCWFRRWRIDGTWERLNAALRKKRLRVRLGKDPEPSAGIVDSQSAKTTGVGGEQRGYDGGKKVRGRKRHLLVDTEGLVLKALGSQRESPRRRRHQAASIRLLLEPARGRLSRLSHLWVEAGYRGRGRRWAEEVMDLSVEVVHKPHKPASEKVIKPAPEKVMFAWAKEWHREGKKVDWQKFMPPRGFQVLPRRWVVERTFAWLSQNRRMSKDYERLYATGEALVYAAMTRLMVRRLARS